MRNKEIITILLLVAFAFLLVGILQYFNLYEGLESGTIPVPPPVAPPVPPPPVPPPPVTPPVPPPVTPPVPPPPTTEPKKKTTIIKYDF